MRWYNYLFNRYMYNCIIICVIVYYMCVYIYLCLYSICVIILYIFAHAYACLLHIFM